MEHVARRPRMTIYIVLAAFMLIIAIAVAIYFIWGSKTEKKPSRGTFVQTGSYEVISG